VHLEHVTVVVADYDSAIEFFVGALGFDLVEDSPSLTRPPQALGGRPSAKGCYQSAADTG